MQRNTRWHTQASRLRMLTPLLTLPWLMACNTDSEPQSTQTQLEPHPGTVFITPLTVSKWNNALPTPGTLQLPPSGTEITMQQTRHDFGLAGGRQTTVWGYAPAGGTPTYLGPTLLANRDEPVQITYRNNLPDMLPFALNTTSEPGPPMVAPIGSAVAHLHGGHTDADSDGTPDQTYANGGTARTFTYPNDQPGTTLWYHDHAMGLTRTNVYAGLAGLYLLRDPLEARYNLPYADAYDVPLVLQDKSFRPDGSMQYPAQWVPEFFGDVAVVNGKAFPMKTVEPRQYRLRLLNGSNARFYLLSIGNETTTLPMTQIGAEGGLLPQSVPLNRLLIAPGERADVIVDFSAARGQDLYLKNDAATPFSGLPDQRGGKPPLPSLVRFRVGLTSSTPDNIIVPTSVPEQQPNLSASDVKVTRYLTLNEVLNPTQGTPVRTLLGTLNLNDGSSNLLTYHDPVTETPRLNETEEWVLINNTVDAHPIHLHLVQFMVIERATVNRVPGSARPNHGDPGRVIMDGGQPQFTNPTPPAPNELGWKDTVTVYPGQMTRIRMKFDRPGTYVWHCHILEHEENDMMRPIEVQPPL